MADLLDFEDYYRSLPLHERIWIRWKQRRIRQETKSG